MENMSTKEQILSIKSGQESTSEIIGFQNNGGLVEINGKPHWLRHLDWRYNHTEWGRENSGFSLEDTSEVGCHIKKLDPEITLRLATQDLNYLKNGYLPSTNTKGVEIEGTIYDSQGNLIDVHDKNFTIEEDNHPELLRFTLERVTGRNNGYYLQSPYEIAHSLGEIALQGIEIAENKNGYITYTSVPEGGDFRDGTVTEHPYLQLAAPKVLKEALINTSKIPQETLDLYSLFGVDIINNLKTTQNLNWPIQALHIHSGMPTHEGLVDTRIAHVSAHMRLTELSKAVSFMLYNSSAVYSQETGLKDARSVIRRLLSTTHDATLPTDADGVISSTIKQLENGSIHSPSRFPVSGQHDRVRIRMEKNFQTVESIDAPMCPDLRLVIAWVMFQSILDTLALESLTKAQGNETEAIKYLESVHGPSLSYQSSLGNNSSYEWDLRFNNFGYRDQQIFDTALKALDLTERIGDSYPSLRTHTAVLNHVLSSTISSPNKLDLSLRLGIVSGKYDASIPYKGLVTDHKQHTTQELIELQHEATKLQAKSLTNVRDDQDLLELVGIE
jgi:hypothetical protein